MGILCHKLSFCHKIDDIDTIVIYDTIVVFMMNCGGGGDMGIRGGI